MLGTVVSFQGQAVRTFEKELYRHVRLRQQDEPLDFAPSED